MISKKTLDLIESARAAGKLKPEAHEWLVKWASSDDYASSHADIERLAEAGDWAELSDAFGEVLPFGTGGRRGPMGPGPNRVNDRTIGESAQGLATYLLKTIDAAGRTPMVVIAFDTRNGSPEFALLAARIFAANGIAARLFDGPR